ncbi:MAG: mycofactocin-coupled SDR family oxidoreductase [Pseudonocardia sp.]|uniref:mycofactocin-coupled SDR family oxidoreductase n=1 Tax=unclassified Pseudonocardia TaxID=2619320 RepID=UPI00086C1906|nr:MULTISPECIES: mycofactocin-coupled SDR family oxidoreductase [unclassified Pseudonocardia]MBN9108333.1 mycofactocin-coupled SDR family oxidoreductase [Pseudonocardia sp.]ODU30315.1 MAG: 3-ketoacyl-ACP reductase [Pseudonocardia sp. SCN 72-51]ODV08712.1 MAG: 3-ketoacyl-ACP reductase [Pseudonocardia sp. SCN 73-27]
MTGRVAGKVALVTGAARGQGRSHAVRLAQEGANIIAVDICAQIDTVPYQMSTPEDLGETVSAVEALDRRIVAATADVRELDALTEAIDKGVAELGRLDIVSAGAGVADFGRAEELTAAQWEHMIGTNLTGVWNTARAAIPHLVAGGRGGSITITSSAAGLRAFENMVHYVAAKHGVVGVMRALALELASHSIRVNTIHPCTVNTAMTHNKVTYDLFAPDLHDPTADDLAGRFRALNALPVPWIEPIDVSNALLFLASDEARYITGVTLPVDAGLLGM